MRIDENPSPVFENRGGVLSILLYVERLEKFNHIKTMHNKAYNL
jgi:hypothetical protein